ncbi:DUF4625 domain-containing protein [Agriterribacter sp.]|uniref:DUF4625 domain-containing protein n=1 Tax=Agriterribacter sp. TaxID=2821509 RepID=UPI002C571470|nr:DUF4625 domain-containing protein [Agriterribacter sp.]HRP55447.1 DUF4625 domain-containing protein [Agriterribacter sp.]
MKQKVKMIITAIGVIIFIAGCSKNKDATDKEYPTIDLTTAAAFPRQCSELARGQVFTAKIPVADNVELGSVSIDIHHNFDHHSHSTEVEECDMDAVKTPSNPFLLVKSISIPAGNQSYTVSEAIDIPGDADPGDYHFMIRVTDKEGWQTIKGLSIKIK